MSERVKRLVVYGLAIMVVLAFAPVSVQATTTDGETDGTITTASAAPGANTTPTGPSRVTDDRGASAYAHNVVVAPVTEDTPREDNFETPDLGFPNATVENTGDESGSQDV